MGFSCANTACAPHPFPSSTLPRPRSEPERTPWNFRNLSPSRSNLLAPNLLTPDNSFPTARFYLSEHRLCSLHLGSFGSPFFVCHPERSRWFAKRSTCEVEGSIPTCPTPSLAGHFYRCATLPPSSSSSTISSAPESPYPHASPPAKTEAKISPPYPAYY